MPSSDSKVWNTGVRGSFWRLPSVRFVLLGLLNTSVTLIVFVLLGLLIQPWLAYSLAFALGIGIVYQFSNSLVFRGQGTFTRKATYVVWYLILFAFAQVVIGVTNPSGLAGLILVGLLTVGIVAPLAYIGGRFIFFTQPPLK